MKAFRVFLCLCLFQLMFVAEGEGMDQKYYDATLSIEIRSDLVVLHVHYVNTSTAEIYIDPSNRNLQVKDTKGGEAEFIGPAVKRLPLKISDYVKLQSGQSYDKEVLLNKLYALRPGHSYSVCMAAGYLNPVSNEFFDGGTVVTTFEVPLKKK